MFWSLSSPLLISSKYCNDYKLKEFLNNGLLFKNLKISYNIKNDNYMYIK